MSNQPSAQGTIAWVDLTVPEAEQIRDFYSAVAGWTFSPVRMGDYDDFNMHPAGGGPPVAGVCHARGPNVGLPPQWLIYVTVENLEAATAQCRDLNGTIVVEPTDMGAMGRYAVIRDPAGAVAALFEPPTR
jgi:hypothetical protein